MTALGNRATRRAIGPEGPLIGLYALFVIAAGGRSAVQLTTHPQRALLAYVLSAVAALAYAAGLVMVVLVARGRSRRVATAWCCIEILAVLGVGSWSVLRPFAFPDATVWSHYGAGYGYLPVVLPILVLGWLYAKRGSSSFRGRLTS